MSIGRNIRESEMLALQAAGYKWFRQICDIWEAATKQEPLDMSLAIIFADRKRQTWDRLCTFAMIYWVAFFTAMLIYNFTRSDLDPHAPPDLKLVITLATPIVGMLLNACFQFWYVWRTMPWGRSLYSEEVQAIMPYLSFFFANAEKNPEDYGNVDLETLYPDAHKILVGFAMKRVELERVDPDHRADGWGIKYDAAGKATKAAHARLKAIGLANKTPTEYYREAERKYSARSLTSR